MDTQNVSGPPAEPTYIPGPTAPATAVVLNEAALPSCSTDRIANIEWFRVQPRWLFVKVTS